MSRARIVAAAYQGIVEGLAPSLTGKHITARVLPQSGELCLEITSNGLGETYRAQTILPIEEAELLLIWLQENYGYTS